MNKDLIKKITITLLCLGVLYIALCALWVKLFMWAVRKEFWSR